MNLNQELTKLFQTDPKLTLYVFHISNHDRISKIEKIFDGSEPLGKGSGSLDVLNIGNVSGR